MKRRALAIAIVVVESACGAPAPHLASSRAAAPATEVTLYRDRALVTQRFEVDVAPAAHATVRLQSAAGVSADDVFVLEHAGLTIAEVHAGGVTFVKPKPAEPITDEESPDDEVPVPPPRPLAPALPGEVEVVVGAPRPGHYALRVGYTTDRLTWDSAYTMTTTPGRDRAVVRGAMVIRNTTGLAFRDARMWVIDAELGTSAQHAADLLRSSLVGSETSTTPAATARELGRFDLTDGDTRIDLLANSPAHRMRSVLVYDPIGTKLDHAGAAPARELDLGVRPAAGARVTESFEVERDTKAAAGLPAGPVRLLERRHDGSLAVLGESRLFDVATRVANVDTIPIGSADGVSGKRERREITVDDDGKRLVEEFAITLDNARHNPVEIVIREHLYRGQNWTLAYRSITDAVKEGPQQISMRTVVPARGTTRVLYVVVYTWP